ncbi:MAG: NUDIX domain-containing protein [Candidatus Aenigmarchaeota archaeon]|nr:NUDIX domain-containing protein [Candidatus Aenigmarchaeota archaeon]
MAKVIALDFDGVLVDSAGGWAFFCSKAWKDIGNRKGPSVAAIKRYRPYIKNATDSYGLLVLLSRASKITRASVKKETGKNPEKAKEFSAAFFKEKDEFIKHHKAKFCDLYAPYTFALPFFRDLAQKNKVYISTNNKKEPVALVLKRSKISIDENNILDHSLSLDKKNHIEIIQEREHVAVRNILFIDDSMDHLENTAKIGAQCALASWGYVLPEDIKKAKKLGMMILDKDNLNQFLVTDNPQEQFVIVDENNNAIGKAPRGEVHSKGIWHRGVHILIFNSKNEILLQKRSMTKDLYKGYWTDAATGHVSAGDSYESAAKRELKEELGISTKLTRLLDFRKFTGNDNEFIRVFVGRHDGPFRVNKEEVDFVKFFSYDKVLKLMRKEKFTPATIVIFEETRKRPELLKRLLSS